MRFTLSPHPAESYEPCCARRQLDHSLSGIGTGADLDLRVYVIGADGTGLRRLA